MIYNDILCFIHTTTKRVVTINMNLMKTINKLLCFIFIIGALNYSAYGQIESLGEALSFMGEEAQGNDENAELTPEQQEWVDKLKEALEKDRENLADLNLSPNLKCGYLMAKSVIAYEALKQKTDSTLNCKKKYDLYGMQAAAIAASTTIMYCPEGIANLTVDEKEQLIKEWEEFRDQVRAEGDEANANLVGDSGASSYQMNKALVEVYTTIINTRDFDFIDWTVYGDTETVQHKFIIILLSKLAERFHPITVVKELLRINEKMAALPCAQD